MLRPRSALLTAALTVAVLLSACSSPRESTTTAAGTSPALALLQQGKYLKANLYGVASYEFSGDVVTWPTSLGVPSVPIVWMGPIFSAELKAVGAGKDTTIQVHGSTSDDGAWVNTLFYSKLIVSKINKDVVFYQVKLRNIPLSLSSGASANQTGTFDKTGADLWKYVEKIEYEQWTIIGDNLTRSAVFKSLDWNNTTRGQEPALSLVFETVPSENMTSDVPSSGGMGMR